MSNLEAPAPSPRPPGLAGVIVWFGAWAGLGGLLGLPIGVDLGWGEDYLFTIAGALVIGGAIAGGILYLPIRGAVARQRWTLAAFLGTAVAFLALELGVIFMLPGLTIAELSLAWIAALVYSLPVLLTAGPLSGVGLVFVWS